MIPPFALLLIGPDIVCGQPYYTLYTALVRRNHNMQLLLQPISAITVRRNARQLFTAAIVCLSSGSPSSA
jgi:hypothetical protein